MLLGFFYFKSCSVPAHLLLKNPRFVFKDKQFELNYDDKEIWKLIVAYGLSVGITQEKLDFPIE